MEENNLNPQDVYDAAYNYALGEEYKEKHVKANIPYDSNWIYSNDNRIVQALGFGLDDGEQAKLRYEKMGINKTNSDNLNLSEAALKEIEEICIIKEERANEKQKEQKKGLRMVIGTLLATVSIGGVSMFNSQSAQSQASTNQTVESTIEREEVPENDTSEIVNSSQVLSGLTAGAATTSEYSEEGRSR